MKNTLGEVASDLGAAHDRAKDQLTDVTRDLTGKIIELGLRDLTALTPANMVLGYYASVLSAQGATRAQIRAFVDDVARYRYDDGHDLFPEIAALPIYPRARRAMKFVVGEITMAMTREPMKMTLDCETSDGATRASPGWARVAETAMLLIGISLDALEYAAGTSPS